MPKIEKVRQLAVARGWTVVKKGVQFVASDGRDGGFGPATLANVEHFLQAFVSPHCGHCGSQHVQRKGVALVAGGCKPRLQCIVCHRWTTVPEVKP
jgi:hypothetical protein